MSIHEDDLVTKIQLRLRDPSTATFSTANIHEAMQDALFDFAEFVPSEGVVEQVGGITALVVAVEAVINIVLRFVTDSKLTL